MRSWAVRAFLVVAVVGLAALVAVAATDDRDLAFTLGVVPGLVAAELRPGQTACQEPVAVAQEFDSVVFEVGTYRRPGVPIVVEIEDLERGRVVARGRVPGGYADNSELEVELHDPVPAGPSAAVCVRNEGDFRVALYGGPELAKRGSSVRVGSVEVPTDLTLVFTGRSRSVLAWTPTVFERAALFRPTWVGAWTFWLLAGLVLLVVPALLARAFGRISDDRA